MIKLGIECTKFERNYSTCTGRSSENICNSSGGAQENSLLKKKKGETQFITKIDGNLKKRKRRNSVYH
jgi:hypothetical protein